MERETRTDRILAEWAAVASEARPPSPRTGVIMRTRFPLATLTGAVALVLAAVAVGAWLNRGSSADLGASSPSPAVSAPIVAVVSPSISPSVAPSDTPSPSPTPTPEPTATPVATEAACDADELAARITMWEGAAGSRIATVQLTSVGTSDCLLDAVARPQLVDGSGAVLINGDNPGTDDQVSIAPGDVLTTLVSAANYCQSAPRPPVSVAFVFANGDRIVAAPESSTDATVPPCNGPGQPGTIEMHAWSK
jgi:hypothetical protein